MRPYSPDLRERIVAAVDRGEHSLRQLARLFAVRLSFIVRLVQRKRKTGSVQPNPPAGGPRRKLDAAAAARLLELVRQQPAATLAELRQRPGIPCALMTIARALQRHSSTRKKKTLHADDQQDPEVQAKRRAFQQKLADGPPERLVFVDETGATTGLTRTHGRAPRGERVQASAPGSWEKVTLLVGMRLSGVVAPMAVAGAADKAVFQTYVEQALAPTLQPGAVVVWDNLPAHQNAAVTAAIEAAGARVEPLPPYSPDLTPIEELFSKGKECLRSLAARTTKTVLAALGSALEQVVPTDILGWFRDRCAYAMPR